MAPESGFPDIKTLVVKSGDTTSLPPGFVLQEIWTSPDWDAATANSASVQFWRGARRLGTLTSSKLASGRQLLFNVQRGDDTPYAEDPTAIAFTVSWDVPGSIARLRAELSLQVFYSIDEEKAQAAKKEAAPGSSPARGDLRTENGSLEVYDGARWLGVSSSPPNKDRWAFGGGVAFTTMSPYSALQIKTPFPLPEPPKPEAEPINLNPRRRIKID